MKEVVVVEAYYIDDMLLVWNEQASSRPLRRSTDATEIIEIINKDLLLRQHLFPQLSVCNG